MAKGTHDSASGATKPAWGKKLSCGGVVVDGRGRLLLRKSAGGFDGTGWNFPKGRPNAGETPEQAALREVWEETGVKATIIAPIPGEYAGETTINRYWLMSLLEETGQLDAETEAARWMTADEARSAIEQGNSRAKRQRDLAVLAAVMKLRADGDADI